MNSEIVISTKYAEAKVYFDFVNAKSRRVYLVKVSFPDAGFYINSITVQPNPKALDRLWVQQPRFFYKGKWMWPVQIEKQKLLWSLIERLALDAVAERAAGMTTRYDEPDFNTGHVKAENVFM